VSLQQQADFGGGIFRSPRAPRGSVYDCVDGLIDDELVIARRGGNAARKSAAGTTLLGLADADLQAGSRTMMWSSSAFYRLNPGDDLTPEAIPFGAPTTPPRAWARAFDVGGAVAMPMSTDGWAFLYGGANTAAYGAGNFDATQGDDTLTGHGTAWVANIEPGMFIAGKIVAEVVSNTEITLRAPWTALTILGLAYSATSTFRIKPDEVIAAKVPAGSSHVASVGTPPRMVLSAGSRIYFTPPGHPTEFAVGDYHEIGGTCLGLDSVRDTLVVFATTGVWLVTDMNLDLTDADGNAQQRLAQINKDVILWDNSGIAGLSTFAGPVQWNGQFIVPALDDVYIFGVDSPAIPISRGIRPLYRAYVAAGYKLGTASLFQGHYFLPVLTQANVLVDVLVCRLDQRDSRGALRPAWTRWSGYAAALGFTGRRRALTAPVLFGVKADRLVDDTACLTPAAANKNDVDGSTFNLDMTLNDLESPTRVTLQKVRVTAEIVDAASDNPTLSASYAVDAVEGAALTGLSGAMSETTTTPKSWPVVKRGRRFRLRLVSSGAAAKVRVRIVEWFVRDSNRP
jgi:hypothetical protein